MIWSLYDRTIPLQKMAHNDWAVSRLLPLVRCVCPALIVKGYSNEHEYTRPEHKSGAG